MNDENQDRIRKAFYNALNKIYVEHGVFVTGVTAKWTDVSTCEESKKLLTILEVEAEL